MNTGIYRLATLLVALLSCSHASADEVGASVDWPLHGLTYTEQRHSPLTQIDSRNVSDLGLAWSYAVGSKRGLEATPIVIDGVLYATGTWSVVFALDAATGKELWRFDPKVPKAKGRDVCCDVVNRGVAVSEGRVFVGTIDGRLIALDAKTGKKIWDKLTVDPERPYSITGAPRVVKDMIVIGNGGADMGVRGFVSAYSAATGEMKWRFYTVPGSKDGPHEHPELIEAAKTWPKDAFWEGGLGGTAWDSIVFDPELNLLYVGTGNSSVYNVGIRSPGGGDNLFLTTILALNPDTGRKVWHYQQVPGEEWDYTATQQMILADIEWKGKPRKVLMQAPKNGFFYILDRKTGELLSANNYADVSWATSIDMQTGRPRVRPEARWADKPEGTIVTPHIFGAHSWHPMSYHPGTGYVYLPTFDLAYLFMPDPNFRFRRGSINTGENYESMSRDGAGYEDMMSAFCSPTQLVAWDPKKSERVWEVRHPSAVPGGVLTTASDLVFQGTGKELVAYNARTGAPLWSEQVGVGVMAAPITYLLNGEQYVAVVAGLGGAAGILLSKNSHTNPGHVFAWKLGGEARLPDIEKKPEPRVSRAPLDASAKTLDRGLKLYANNCMRCHGPNAVSGGLLPDLRYASREIHENWVNIVLGGTRAHDGMASFADLLTPEDAKAIQAFVLERAHYEPTALQRIVKWIPESGLCLPASWLAD